MKVKVWHIMLVLVLLAGLVAGCGAVASTSSVEESATTSVEGGGNDANTSAILDDSYDNALPVGSQLALGTFQLEGTKNAVTPEQARILLPPWQAIQGGTLQSETETDAVLKQIEGTMTAEQLAAIAAMHLTLEDLGAWAQVQGLNLGPSPEAVAADRAAGDRPGGPGANLSEEDRGAMRATAQAGGGMPGGRQAGAGAGQLAILAEPLVELLTLRAAE